MPDDVADLQGMLRGKSVSSVVAFQVVRHHHTLPLQLFNQRGPVQPTRLSLDYVNEAFVVNGYLVSHLWVDAVHMATHKRNQKFSPNLRSLCCVFISRPPAKGRGRDIKIALVL